jgi:hypothetical protein
LKKEDKRSRTKGKSAPADSPFEGAPITIWKGDVKKRTSDFRFPTNIYNKYFLKKLLWLIF